MKTIENIYDAGSLSRSLVECLLPANEDIKFELNRRRETLNCCLCLADKDINNLGELIEIIKNTILSLLSEMSEMESDDSFEINKCHYQELILQSFFMQGVCLGLEGKISDLVNSYKISEITAKKVINQGGKSCLT